MTVRTIERIYILFDEQRKGQEIFSLSDILGRILLNMNWSFDVCVHSEKLSEDLTQIERTGNVLCSFLEDYGFMRMNWFVIHPLGGSKIADLFRAYHTLYRMIQPFREEGYEKQTESRLNLFPILKVTSEIRKGELFFSLASFLQKRSIPVGLYMSRDPSFHFIFQESVMRAESIILELEGEKDPVGRVIRSIWAHRLFDMWLDRFQGSSESGIDEACPAHIVLDEASLSMYGCWRDFVLGRPLSSSEKRAILDPVVKEALMKHSTQEGCQACMDSALMDMGPTLKVNRREHQGVRVFVARSNALIRKEDYVNAAAFLSIAIESERDPSKKVALYTQKGICYLKAGDAQSAFEALDRARDLDPDSGDVLYHLGLSQFQLKNYIDATDLFDQACLKGLTREILRDLYFYKGIGHIHLEEFDEAIQAMEEAERVGAEKAPVLFYRGMGHLGKKAHTKAICFFKKALDADPTTEDRGRILFYIGICHKEQQRYREAIPWLKKAGEMEGPSQEMYNLMGFCHFRLKEHDLAISCFEKAIEIDPQSAIDYANIGSNLRELGRIAEAVQMYQKALQIDPSIQFARENLRKLEETEMMRKGTL